MRAWLCTFVAGALAFPFPAVAKWVDLKNVEGWQISRHTEQPTCSMSSMFDGDGSTFVFLVYTPAKDEAYLSVKNENWKSIVDGEIMTLDFQLGEEKWSGVKVKGFNEGDSPEDSGGFTALFDGKEFIIDFALAPSLVITKGSIVVDRLNLKGSRAAVLALSSCANGTNNGLLKDPFAF